MYQLICFYVIKSGVKARHKAGAYNLNGKLSPHITGTCTTGTCIDLFGTVEYETRVVYLYFLPQLSS